MNDLFRIYRETVFESSTEISKIQKELQTSIPLNEIDDMVKYSSEKLISLWQSGRKVNRTSFALRVIPDFPNELLKISLLLDAIVNLFDDLIDEKMDKAQQQITLLELIRVLSQFECASLPVIIRERIAFFLNKGIVIAISENTFLSRLAQIQDFDEQLKSGIQIYDCRSIDIDIFLGIPLLWKDENFEIKPILTLARNYRALSLLQKDLHDLSYDNINGSHTPISIISAKMNGNGLNNYVHKWATYYFDKCKNMKKIDSFRNRIMNNLIKESENIFTS
ncbi:MAG: hypothetical protein ACTSUK_07285, partial [Promethearchaeota archaeon]